MVKRITVIKFDAYDGGGNGASCCGVEVTADTAKLMYMITAKDEAKVASRVGGVE